MMLAEKDTQGGVTATSRSTRKQDAELWWAEFTATQSEFARNKLIECYFPLVKYNADRISARLPHQVDGDDLVSVGIFGLKDAIEAFDPSRGIKFETYCTARIRGAILDELRAMDWVPRLVRSRAQRYQGAAGALEAELGRRPTDEEIAHRMDLPGEEYRKLRDDAAPAAMLSLWHKPNDSDDTQDQRDVDTLQDRRNSGPVDEMQKRDVLELVTRGLSRAERLILILYYYEQMNMKDIGATLDLSESRVSQMHSSILKRLKHQLQLRRLELVA